MVQTGVRVNTRPAVRQGPSGDPFDPRKRRPAFDRALGYKRPPFDPLDVKPYFPVWTLCTLVPAGD